MHFSIFSFEGEFSSKFIYWLFLLQQKCNFTHNYRLSRKHKPEEEKNKYCHIPENRVKNLSNPLVSSLIITCNLLSVCIVQLFFATVSSRRSCFFAPLYFFMCFFVWKRNWIFVCMSIRYRSNFQHKKPTTEWKAPRYFIFFWYSTILPFLRVLCVVTQQMRFFSS